MLLYKLLLLLPPLVGEQGLQKKHRCASVPCEGRTILFDARTGWGGVSYFTKRLSPHYPSRWSFRGHRYNRTDRGQCLG